MHTLPKKGKIICLLLMISSLIFPASSFAQSTRGELAGSVADATGGTVALTSGSPNHPLGLAIRRQPGTGGSQSGSHCGRLACM